ncbi:MAG TPA: hypothetical protein VJ343_00995 [archaeon]|nr:hypothetical protein [archaeon]
MPAYKESKLTVVKLGGSVIGYNCENIPLIIKRIKNIREKDCAGPVVVVSAPKGITDEALKIGEKYANGSKVDLSNLWNPYVEAMNNFMKEPYRSEFKTELLSCKEKVGNSLGQVVANKRFVDVNRARILGYSGEILAAIAIDYIINSHELEACHMPLENWPIVTDKNFENASFLYGDSRERLPYLREQLEKGKIPVIGGFIGVTKDGLETTYERGGSDRSAANLGILLDEAYDVVIDFEKDEVVMSANPKVVKDRIGVVRNMSYNEVKLAGPFGMSIVDPIAIKDIETAGLGIKLVVTNFKNPEYITTIQKESNNGGDPVKIDTGRENCAIFEFDKKARFPLEYHINRVKKYYDYVELTPSPDVARFLFPDSLYFKKNEEELKSLTDINSVSYEFGAVALIGDKMQEAADVAATAFGAIKGKDITVYGGDLPGPTLISGRASRILMIVKNKDVNNCIRIIHNEMKK